MTICGLQTTLTLVMGREAYISFKRGLVDAANAIGVVRAAAGH